MNRVSFLALFALGSGAGCSTVLGDFQIGSDRTGEMPDATQPAEGGADATAGTDGADGPVAEGSEAAEGSALRDGSAGSDGRVLEGGGDVAAGGDGSTSCLPGEMACGADNTPFQCDEAGVRRPLTACTGVCAGGVCSGNCVPAATRCAAGSPNMVETCDATGQWGPASACTFVCDAATNNCGGECAPGMPNQCAGNTVQKCSPTGRWTAVTTCTATPCSGGTCRACAPAEKQCNGGKPQTCSAAALWVDDQASACPFVCDAATGKCAGECVPASDTCAAGPASKHCGANGMYGAATPCPNLCDATTGRCGGTCPPAAQRCNGSTAQTCGGNGQWGSDTACPFGCNMATGLCNGCADEPMATTCSGGKCGPTANNCGHTVQCPTSCAGTGQTCGGGSTMGVCGCSAETNPMFCSRLGTNCGSVTGADNCGTPRTAACGVCTAPLVCEPASGPKPNLCCMPETDASLCMRLGKNCNSLTATDNCGNSRTANCGTCVSPQTCAGGSSPSPNVCGCSKETDASFCARLSTTCGPLTGTDNCGVARTAPNCGGCSPSQICSAGQCLLAPGQLCAAASQCGSGVCGGRCCSPGVPCTCPQPHPQNLLQNPGFDGSLAGWTTDVGAGGSAWEPETPPDANGIFGDATSCPFSGSAFLSAPTSATIQRIWQCVPVSPQTSYNFGVRIHTDGGASSYCGVDLYPGAGCTGTATNVALSSWINVDWSPDLSTTFGTTIYASARVSCYVDTSSFQGAFFFDTVYLTPAPGAY